MLRTYLLNLVVLPICLFAQDIDTYRLTKWSNAGLITDIDNNKTTLFSSNYAFDLSGKSSNSSLLNQIIQNAKPQTTIILEKGLYLFESPIVLKSDITLKGIDSSTVLRFNNLGENDCIKAIGVKSKDSLNIYQSLSKFDSFIVAPNHNFKANDILKIESNDSAYITSSWALKSTGQLVRVSKTSNDTLFLYNTIRRYFSANQWPYLIKINPIKNVKIENLKIERKSASNKNTSNIALRYALNCQINCIESYACDFAHVELSNAIACCVKGNYFQDGLDYGGGGSAYGAVLQFTTGNSLVEHNTFNHLRHSILLQAGANGNAIIYNYSTNPFWEGTISPNDAAGDLVLHGNYVYANLFEGNSVQNIVIDDSHGQNGPNNVFFRNRASGYGIVMNTTQPSDSQIIIGNEITNTTLLKGLFSITGNGVFSYGNNIKGTITPKNTSDLQDNSYFYKQPPQHYTNMNAWPVFGYPKSLGQHINASELDFKLFSIKTKCISKSLNAPKLEIFSLNIHPNPTSRYINIESKASIVSVEIIDVRSGIIFKTKNYEKLDLSNLSKGIYILKIQSNKASAFKKIILN